MNSGRTAVTADIAIIGAGVAGCIAALALSSKYEVLLIDKSIEPKERAGECLPGAARRILHQLGLLEEFEQQGHLQSLGVQSSWGSEHTSYNDYIRNPDGYSWHLDRQKFELFLRQKAAEKVIQTNWPVKVSEGYLEDRLWNLRLSDNSTALASYVIDAGGRQSPFARLQGVKRESFDRLIACWAVLDNTTENRMALIVSDPNGWWYSAPLPGNKRVLVFHTDTDLIDIPVKTEFSAFIKQALNNPALVKSLLNFQAQPGINPEQILSAGTYHGITVANSTRLTQVAGKQWAAIGDAALSFDPLSSQGMFNAMACAVQFSELMKSGKNIQTEYVTQISNIWRQYEHHKLIYYGQEKRWHTQNFWQRRQAI